MEKSQKLSKAKRDYPKGVKFISPLSHTQYISSGVFEVSRFSRNVYCQYPTAVAGLERSVCIYRSSEDKWAEVVTQTIAA